MSEVIKTAERAGTLKIIDRIIERVCFYSLVIAGALTVIMVLATTYGVIRRYIFRNPEPYSYEITTMFFLFSFVLAVAYVDRGERHIRVDLLSNLFPARVQNILLNVLAPVLGLTFIALMTWQGWNVALYSLKIGEVSLSVWAEPLWPIKMMIPIGYGILCLALLARLLKGIRSLGGPERSKNTVTGFSK